MQDNQSYLESIFKPALYILAFLSDPSPIIGYPCQWLTNSLTDSLLFSRPDLWPWRVKMTTQNLLKLLLLLMLTLKIVLTTYCCSLQAMSSRFVDLLNLMIYDLKRSVDQRWLFDPVLNSSLDDVVRITLNKSAHHKKKVLSGLITKFCRDTSIFSGSWEIFIFCAFP